MTDADMVDAPASTPDAAAAASAAAAAKALAKGKAPANAAANAAAASSADALARAAATAASAPWVEKYRPNTLDDVASHGEIIETSEWGEREREGKERKKARRFDGIKTIEPSRKSALSTLSLNLTSKKRRKKNVHHM